MRPPANTAVQSKSDAQAVSFTPIGPALGLSARGRGALSPPSSCGCRLSRSLLPIHATRRVARALAAELGAELEEIRCPKYRPGFFGFWQAGYASWRSKIPEIVPPMHDPTH